MSEGISVRNVHPQRQNEEETQADDRCDPVMGASLRIYHFKKCIIENK